LLKEAPISSDPLNLICHINHHHDDLQQNQEKTELVKTFFALVILKRF